MIGKAASHGCVRLTNWDAERLAAMLSRGISVDFIDKPDADFVVYEGRLRKRQSEPG